MADDRVGGQLVGRGRSGVVYCRREASGRLIARKLFTPDRLARLVMGLLTGAPNPYAWCAPAADASLARRRILGHLVRFWFGDRLRLPQTYGLVWNDDHRAYELHMELVNGRHAPLWRGEAGGDGQAVRELRRQVMLPLQRRLMEAGCDGQLWQAGLSNPVAAGNFMIDANGPSAASGDARHRWVWVDLESGVPALFAINPLTLLTVYLPRCVRHGGLLFDDIDTATLRRYLDARVEALRAALGAGAHAELLTLIDELEGHQRRFRAMSRLDKSVGHHEATGRVTAEQAEHYRSRPVRWYGRLAGRAAASGVRAAAGGLMRAAGWLAHFPWRRRLLQVGLFTVSQRFRTRLARRYVLARIDSWARRSFIQRAVARELGRQLRQDEAADYITDFGVHLAIKPLVKVVQYSGAVIVGLTTDVLLGVLIAVWGGSLARTAYTLGRLAQATVHGKPRPWVALAVGALPGIGSAAYPVQLVHSSARADRPLARFILFDTFARFGHAVPVWGGRDTLTEHLFNRLPGVLLALWLRPVAAPALPRSNP